MFKQGNPSKKGLLRIDYVLFFADSQGMQTKGLGL